MSVASFERALYWIVRVGAYALPFTLLLVIDNMFFPFVSGKAFVFRVIIELMAAAWVGLLVIDFKRYWLRWNFLSIALTVFVGSIFVTSFFGVDFTMSLWSNFERMEGLITYLHILLLFFALAGTFHTRREWVVLLSVSIFASVLVAFYGLLEATGEISSLADSPRIIATLGNPLYVAAYLSFNIFLAMFLWLETTSSTARWFLGGVVLFEGAIFFMTGARGAFLGILAGLGVIMLLLLVTADGWRKKCMFGSIIVIMMLLPVALHTFKDSPLIRQSSQISRFANITLQSGDARFTIWGMAWESFKERPILGWGAGNFIVPFAKHYDPNMFTQEPWFDRTHNMFFEWLVAGGAIGFLAYLALFTSFVPTLMRGVKQQRIQSAAAFVFLGMIVSYMVQLFFVFDTQATYLMLIVTLGFSYAVSSRSSEEWLQESTLALSPFGAAEQGTSDAFGQRRSRRFRRDMKMQSSTADENRPALSLFQAGVITSVFAGSFLCIAMLNVRPYMANLALMDALNLFSRQQLTEATDAFNRALKLSRGTIGTEEIRENITFNMYSLFQNKELMKKPEGEALYQLAVGEMEKQVAENSKKDLKIKQNILLAQLYHQWALSSNDREALTKAFGQYDLVLQFAPSYASVYPIVANLYAQVGNMDEATRLIEKAADLLTEAGKYDARIFYSQALFYTVTKRYDDASAVLEEINAKYSFGEGLDAEMVNNIILATRSQGADAIPFLERLYSIDKKLTGVVLMLAQLYAVEGNKEKARFYAQEALEADPSIQERVQAFLNALDAP